VVIRWKDCPLNPGFCARWDTMTPQKPWSWNFTQDLCTTICGSLRKSTWISCIQKRVENIFPRRSGKSSREKRLTSNNTGIPRLKIPDRDREMMMRVKEVQVLTTARFFPVMRKTVNVRRPPSGAGFATIAAVRFRIFSNPALSKYFSMAHRSNPGWKTPSLDS